MKRFFILLLLVTGYLSLVTFASGQDSTNVTNLSTVRWRGRTSVPSLSSTNNAVCYFDNTQHKLLCSQNGGAFADLGGGGGLTVGTTAITGGTATRLLYETSGNKIGEISGATSDGISTTFASANLIATRPKFLTSIDDTNGNEVFKLTATASAVNEFTIANAAAGASPTFTASGSDTDIGGVFQAKGGGLFKFVAGSGSSGAIIVQAETDNITVRNGDGSTLCGRIQRNSGDAGLDVRADSANLRLVASSNVLIETNNLIIGASTGPSANGGKVLIFGDNAAKPTLAASTTATYQKSGEQYVLDAAGNETLISPHEPGTDRWIFMSCNSRTHRCIKVDMEELVRQVERLSGKRLKKEWRQ